MTGKGLPPITIKLRRPTQVRVLKDQTRDRFAESMASTGGRIHTKKGVRNMPMGSLHNLGLESLEIPKSRTRGDEQQERTARVLGQVIKEAESGSREPLADRLADLAARHNLRITGHGEKTAAPDQRPAAPPAKPAAPAPTRTRKEKPPRQAQPAPARPARPAAPTPTRTRKAEPPRQAEPAETKVQTPQTKFRLSTGQKIHRTVNLLLAAAAIGAVFAPISTGVMLIIAFGAGITGMVSSIFTAFSIRDSKLNFKGLGILSINSEEFSPEAQTAIRQGLVALKLGQGINTVFIRTYQYIEPENGTWQIHRPAEKEAVEALLFEHLATKSSEGRSDTRISFKVVKDGEKLKVVFSLNYRDQRYDYHEKPLLILRPRFPY